MDLENKKELTAQEVELLNDFQMEELEERLEMDSWFKNGAEVGVGVGQQPSQPTPPTQSIQPSEPTPPPTTPPPTTPPTQPGTVPIGGGYIRF